MITYVLTIVSRDTNTRSRLIALTFSANALSSSAANLSVSGTAGFRIQGVYSRDWPAQAIGTEPLAATATLTTNQISGVT